MSYTSTEGRVVAQVNYRRIPMSKIPHFVSSVPSINTHGLASDSLLLIPRLVTLGGTSENGK